MNINPSVYEEAAGQYEEHEAARSLHPFMFDYYNDTAEKKLSVRIGKQYRKVVVVANWTLDDSL